MTLTPDEAREMLFELEYLKQIGDDLEFVAQRINDAAETHTNKRLNELLSQLNAVMLHEQHSFKAPDPDNDDFVMESLKLGIDKINETIGLVKGRMMHLDNRMHKDDNG